MIIGAAAIAARGRGVPAPTTAAYNTLLLDGSSQYIDLGDVIDAGTGDLSISVWFKSTNTASNQMIIAKQSGASNESYYRIYTDTSSDIHASFSVDSITDYYDWKTNGLTPLDGEWHHIVFFTDRASNKPVMYYDNTLQTLIDANSSGDVSSGDSSNSASLMIGRRDIGGSPVSFAGSISQAMITTDEITSDEVNELYNSGVAKQPWEYSSSITSNYVLALPLNSGVATAKW